MEERLQKLLSAAGVCSRRAAEEYITAGRVTVNGVLASLGQRADPNRDEIRVNGRPLAPKARPVYLLLNKPRGYVTTLSDEKDGGPRRIWCAAAVFGSILSGGWIWTQRGCC